MTLHPDTIHALSDALRAAPQGTVEIRIYPRGEPSEPHCFAAIRPFEEWNYMGRMFTPRAHRGPYSDLSKTRRWTAHGRDGNILEHGHWPEPEGAA